MTGTWPPLAIAHTVPTLTHIHLRLRSGHSLAKWPTPTLYSTRCHSSFSPVHSESRRRTDHSSSIHLLYSCSSCAVACLRLTPVQVAPLFKSGCDRAAFSWHASVCCLTGASAIAMITALTLPGRARGSSSCQLYPSLLVSAVFFYPHICQCLKPHLGRTQVNLPDHGLRLVTLFSQSCLFKSEQVLSWARCPCCIGSSSACSALVNIRAPPVFVSEESFTLFSPRQPLFTYNTARR